MNLTLGSCTGVSRACNLAEALFTAKHGRILIDMKDADPTSPPCHWPRAIAHVDLDQFYAAVEVLDFPELKGKALIVGGLPGNRGVVCTASYEARKFGVHSAMPSGQAARLCPHAIWRAPRMSRYAEKSREIHAIFERYTDAIEPLSLDEAFLDLTGSLLLFGPFEQIARRIKSEIRSDTGLVASVGLAANKFLAKVASDFEKPDGFVVVAPEKGKAFLAPMPVSRLWGVGPKMQERLHALRLFTIGELSTAEPTWLAGKIGKQAAEHIIALANGIDARDVESGNAAKSIGRENTFAADLYELPAMERELLAFADDVARRLRAQKLRCLTLTLKVKFGDFSRITRSHTLDEPTDVAGPLYAAAIEMLRHRVDLQGKGVRLLGLSAHKLRNQGETTESLFPDERTEKNRKMAQVMDRVRARFGAGAVVFGRLLEGREKNTGTPSDTLPEPESGQ